MVYTVKRLAEAAGISVRTLHYYDEIGLLKPLSYGRNGYRRYGDNEASRLQQIMFFRELGFALSEIKDIMTRPEYDMLEALESHRTLLRKKSDRCCSLLDTVEKTIRKLREGKEMSIKEYYEGFSEKQIEGYRQEVKQRWGEKTLENSEKRVLKMGKEKFREFQTEGGKIFQAVADNMGKRPENSDVQAIIARWREWLENFSHYEDEAVLELGRAYSQDTRFAAFFKKFGEKMPAFFSEAVEIFYRNK